MISISAKGNCYDNACVESFFRSLKVEAIYGETFATRKREKGGKGDGEKGTEGLKNNQSANLDVDSYCLRLG